MARIRLDSIKKIEKKHNSLHDPVNATYSIFELDGEKYLQIDTYGRIDRMEPGKLSQSFQIDEETAKYLARLLFKEFFTDTTE